MNTKTVIIAGVALGLFMVAQRAKGQVSEAVKQLDPVDPDNIINRGFHRVYGVFTDHQGSLGTDIYELFHK